MIGGQFAQGRIFALETATKAGVIIEDQQSLPLGHRVGAIAPHSAGATNPGLVSLVLAHMVLLGMFSFPLAAVTPDLWPLHVLFVVSRPDYFSMLALFIKMPFSFYFWLLLVLALVIFEFFRLLITTPYRPAMLGLRVRALILLGFFGPGPCLPVLFGVLCLPISLCGFVIPLTPGRVIGSLLTAVGRATFLVTLFAPAIQAIFHAEILPKISGGFNLPAAGALLFENFRHTKSASDLLPNFVVTQNRQAKGARLIVAHRRGFGNYPILGDIPMLAQIF